MKCFQHNDRDAVGTCASCGGAGCRECLNHYAGAKLCAQCATNVFESQKAAIVEHGARAKRKLKIALFVTCFFGLTGMLFWGLIGANHGVVAAITSGIGGALWCGYSWGTTYLGAIPFVRFFGSRLSGGAISDSPGGALFGVWWFWVVAGWWLFFLGSVYAFFGGGIYHLIKLLRSSRQTELELQRLLPPPQANPALAA